uniref:NADH-ubiquinone oxidoreductase chain 4 n=1 Tax=Parafilaroides normani TaxID=1519083 RepID=A0A075R2J8_PARNR|nr:NADH dehydrogenase subunit 4 [Parafilaroides normani]AIG23808.1 NADH dehydrogenase subunit 4 [Parafilaroides normani]
MDFLLFSALFFSFPILFMFFFTLVGFLMFNSSSWMGLFILVDSNVFILLLMMMLFIYGVLIVSELDASLVFLSSLLISFCFFFFILVMCWCYMFFFELSMLPILVMIIGFGSQIEKISSSYYLLFYATFCSLPFLFVYYKSLFYLSYNYFDFFLSWEMFFLLSLSFMMKFPVYFLHLWLPKAHVEAPTTASMLLAGLLLKLGTAGFLRILGSMNFTYSNFWVFLSLSGMVLSSFSCLFQSDVKSLAAYSSIAHMSFLLLSLSLLLIGSKSSSLMMMLAHGYSSTLMFFMIGEFFHVSSSRLIYFFNSFMSSSIIFSLILFLVFLSNSSIPPSLSFLSEFIIIVSSFMFSKVFFLLVFVYFFISFFTILFMLLYVLVWEVILWILFSLKWVMLFHWF